MITTKEVGLLGKKEFSTAIINLEEEIYLIHIDSLTYSNLYI